MQEKIIALTVKSGCVLLNGQYQDLRWEYSEAYEEWGETEDWRTLYSEDNSDLF